MPSEDLYPAARWESYESNRLQSDRAAPTVPRFLGLRCGDIADFADGTDRAEPGWVDGEAIGGMMVR